MIALLLALQATVTEALPADVSAAAAQTVAQASMAVASTTWT